MSKLPKQYQFLDLSDYGRPVARFIAQSLKHTDFTPIHVTSWFIVSGLVAVYCMIQGHYWAAAFFLILKSILDAADGELARVKETPSYIGRYYDSVADILLNLLFLLTIRHISDGSWVATAIAFFGIQLQGTLYNYYYVILRNKCNGDTTSRIFEDHTPIAFDGEDQKSVDRWYWLYNTLYKTFDIAIYRLDQKAVHSEPFPKWFMTAVSTFGLGFQLLIISIMFVLQIESFIIPFFIGYSIFIGVFIVIRRMLNQESF